MTTQEQAERHGKLRDQINVALAGCTSPDLITYDQYAALIERLAQVAEAYRIDSRPTDPVRRAAHHLKATVANRYGPTNPGLEDLRQAESPIHQRKARQYFRRISAIAELHSDSGGWCNGDDMPWPCPTARLLMEDYPKDDDA